MNEDKVDVIETNIMFGTEVKIYAKIKKVTTYGNAQSEYKLIEVAGVSIDSDILDDEDNRKIAKVLREILIDKVKAYDEEMKKK